MSKGGGPVVGESPRGPATPTPSPRASPRETPAGTARDSPTAKPRPPCGGAGSRTRRYAASCRGRTSGGRRSRSDPGSAPSTRVLAGRTVDAPRPPPWRRRPGRGGERHSPRLMSSHLATRRERAPPTEGRSSRQEAPRHRRTRRPRPARVRRRHRTPARGRPLRQARSARRGCRHPGRPRQRRRDYRTRRFGGALRPRPTMSSGLNPSTPSSAPCATTCALSPARTSSRPAASSPRTTCCPWASSRSGHAPGNRPPQLEARDAFRKVSSSVAWCAWRAAAGRG